MDSCPSHSSKYFLTILISVLSSAVLWAGFSAQAYEYPYRLPRIEKGDVEYATPEETYAANISALLSHDLDWYYETLTAATAAEDKELFLNSGIDPTRKFDLVDTEEEIFILENIVYKTGVLLIAISRRPDGFVMRGSVTLVQVDGQWKITSEFGHDPELDKYDDMVMPEQQVHPFSVLFHPDELDLGWYQKVKAQQVEHEDVICVLQGAVVVGGNNVKITEIVPSSMYLNDLVPHSPWLVGKNKQIDVVVLSTDDDYVPGKLKSFNSWWKKARIPFSQEQPVMLVKFNKYQVFKSLPDLTPGKEYGITVTGYLKNDTPFRSIVKVNLTEKTTGNKTR